MAGGAACGHADCAQLPGGQVGGADTPPGQAGLGWPRAAGVHQPVPRVELQPGDGKDQQRGRRALKLERETKFIRRFPKISQSRRKAPTRAFSWLKVLSQLRHYAEQAPKHGKRM